MSDVENNTGGTTNNDWVAKELEQARAELKNATTNAAKNQAMLKIGALKMVNWPKSTIEKTKTANKLKLDKSNQKLAEARKAYTAVDKEIEWAYRADSIYVIKGNFDSDHNVQNMKPEERAEWDARKKLFNDWRKKNPKGSQEDYQEFLLAERKKQGRIIKQERDVNIPKYKGDIKKCDLALGYIEKYGTPSRKNSNGRNGNSGGGNGGGAGGGKREEEQTLTKEYKDKDGNVIATATYDKDGKMLNCQFKDKDGKDQTLKSEEIQKANVNVDDIKKALEEGNLEKALELLFKALAIKNNNYQPVQEQQAQPTFKEYRDGTASFRVDKEGDKITSVTFMEDGVMLEPLKLNAEQFTKAGIDPKNVEAALEKKDYKSAAMAIFDTAEKNNINIKTYSEPKVELKGDSIVLTDRLGQTFELNKAKLKAMNLNTNTSGTMKKLKEAVSIEPRPKGMEYAIASYFRGANPAPDLPPQEKGQYTVARLEKSSVDMIRGVFGTSTKSVYITVQDAQGKKKELHAEDFAKYYGCDKAQGKKILRAYARAIENGADMNGVISAVAEQAPERNSSRTLRTVGAFALGTAAVGGAYLGGKALYNSLKKDDNEETSEASGETPTETKTEVKANTFLGTENPTEEKPTDTGNTDTGNTDTGNTDTGNTDTRNTDTGNRGTGNSDTGSNNTGNTDGPSGKGGKGLGNRSYARRYGRDSY